LTWSAAKYFLLPSVWMKFPGQATPHSHISEMLVLKSLWTMSYGMGQMVSNFWRRVWNRNQHNTCSHSLLAVSTLTRVPVSTFVVLLDFCIQGQSNQRTITTSIYLATFYRLCPVRSHPTIAWSKQAAHAFSICLFLGQKLGGFL
jgi:hypothetical protein